MSLYILDTDIVSLFQQGDLPVVQRINGIPTQNLAVTIVTLEEQLRGRLNIIRKATSPERLVAAYARLKLTFDFFYTVNVLAFTPDACDRFNRLKQQKIRIGTQDLRIAAIALSVGGIVITRNQRDFGKVPDLILEDWTL
ncbi:type II toxin-antitoxin system VapC family toxin [Roseofilum sp. Guam]|uniref:type II toxin-antitoxin system VapC family toxin n=1 Tax=Roseofilum sp. Guam TaxID=2821502 RepID=UPI001B2A25C2|nr:type II toxin-antitoxin system VapC family toxin [Roseofilum sp. Guam]MBP0030857.1 type II toxin-antitoxin system VapC family toxin [Roseofilum sp. Guam]